MAMQYLERELRRGNAKDQAYADIVAGVLRARGKDVAFPKVAVTGPSKETVPVEVRKFCDEARIALEKEGYVIDTLTGQSIASLRKAGRKFWTDWHKEYPQFEALTSIQSEVAINPGQLFIPKSNNATLAKQEEMINKFSQELGKKIPGVNAIMGGMADYVDLALTHLDVTGDYLFGEKYDYNWARTNTPTVGTLVANVGRFPAANGLCVYYWDRGHGVSGVFAAPLVVPKA